MDQTLARKYLASPLAKFRPWTGTDKYSPQKDFMQAASTHRIRIFRAGNQTGKTTISCVDALLRLLGWHPFCNHQPPIYGWMVALDWEWGVGQVLWPKMREYLPWDEVRSVLWYRKNEPSLPQSIIFKNGSQLDFKSAESGRGKFQGAALHFVAVDEETPAEIIEECRARLVRRGGHFWASLTPVRRERWVMELEKQAACRTIRASMSMAAKAGILEDEGVIAYLESLPDRQRAVREYGDFAALEGLVYPEFTYDQNVLYIDEKRGCLADPTTDEAVYTWPLPAGWPRYASMDFGYVNATCVIVTALEPMTRTLIVERVLYATDIRITQWARFMRDLIPHNLRLDIIADHDVMEREELRARGWNTIPAEKDIVTGIEATQRRFMVKKDTGKPGIYLAITKPGVIVPKHPMLGRMDAYWLAWEIESYRYPSRKSEDATDPKDVPLKKDDHACDALRYMVRYLDGKGLNAPRAGTTRARRYGTLEHYLDSAVDPTAPKGPARSRKHRTRVATLADRMMGSNRLLGLEYRGQQQDEDRD